MTVHWLAANDYRSVRFAYIWCITLAEDDPSMGGESGNDMKELYRYYAVAANHFGTVIEKWKNPWRHHPAGAPQHLV
jgi:hypothetical protein